LWLDLAKDKGISGLIRLSNLRKYESLRKYEMTGKSKVGKMSKMSKKGFVIIRKAPRVAGAFLVANFLDFYYDG
jgi:hypothetical protein